MPDFNNDILIKNIKLQMQKHNETQSQLAEVIGMTQSNFSKAINGVESKRFSIEQLYGISQHYGVGIDQLMNNASSFTLGTVDICKFIKALIENSEAVFVDCELSETVYYNSKNRPSYLMPGTSSQKVKHEYKGLVFNIYQEDFSNCMNDQETQDKISLYESLGNDSYKAKAINEFINGYIEIYRLYKTNFMSEAVYRAAVDGLLNKADIDFLL